MFVQTPRHPNGVLIVCDQRQKSDVSLNHSTNKVHVMEMNAVLKASFGKAYHNVTRLALYDYKQKPTKPERDQARRDYKKWLADNAKDFKCMVVLPTPSQAMSQEATTKGTQVWRDLAPPDSLDEMRGTWWRSLGDTLICPVFTPLGVIGQIQLSFMRQWCQAALAIASGQASVLKCRPVTDVVCPEIGEAMRAMKGRPLAVDIETIPNSDLITAIGLATDTHAVSIPFDGFEPACGSGKEQGLSDYGYHGALVRGDLERLLAADTPKLLHNGTFDAPQLAARGLPLGGELHDTLAMHAIAYPESRHALQIAAATQLIVPPWKSLFKPRDAASRVLDKNAPEYWYWDAATLRDYNAKDAFYTWHLGNTLAWKVGVKL